MRRSSPGRFNRHVRGQSLTETVVLVPLYLFFAFGLLQFCQLGVALILCHYTASSIARKAANEKAIPVVVSGEPVDISDYQQKADDLMVAGMTVDQMIGCVTRDDPTVPTADLEVFIRAKLHAWPFFADLLHGVWKSDYDAQALPCPDNGKLTGIGPFNFSSQAPYYFYITGKSKVRLNYVP